MSASSATTDTLLRQAGMRLKSMPAGRLAPRDLNVPFQVRLGLPGIRVPVSRRVSAVSSRTFMSHVGCDGTGGVL
jgi:hypothetical protein